jgi:hypothetical protein
VVYVHHYYTILFGALRVNPMLKELKKIIKIFMRKMIIK